MTFDEIFSEWHSGEAPKGVLERKRFIARVQPHEIPAFIASMRRRLENGPKIDFLEFLVVWKDVEPDISLTSNLTSDRSRTCPRSEVEPDISVISDQDQIRRSNPKSRSGEASGPDPRPSGLPDSRPEPNQSQTSKPQTLQSGRGNGSDQTKPLPASDLRIQATRTKARLDADTSEPYERARWAFEQIRAEYDGRLTPISAAWAAFLKVAPDLETANRIYNDVVRYMSVEDERRSVFGPRLDTYLLERMFEQGRAYAKRYDGSETVSYAHRHLLQD